MGVEPDTGFEPAMGFPTVYKTVAIDRSANPAQDKGRVLILSRPVTMSYSNVACPSVP